MTWEKEQNILKALLASFEKNTDKWNKKTIKNEIENAGKLCESYVEQSSFTANSEQTECIEKVLKSLLNRRLFYKKWRDQKPVRSDWTMVLTQLFRVFLRDKHFQASLLTWHESYNEQFVDLCDWLFNSYITSQNEHSTSSARAVLSVGQKLCQHPEGSAELAKSNLHKVISPLLSCRDMVVLQAAVQLLGTLAEHSETARTEIVNMNVIDQLVTLLAESDLVTQKLCGSLLRVLCCEQQAREQLKVYDGLQVLMSQLSTRNVRLQWHLAWTLTQLAEDTDTATEMGQLGIIQLILSEINDFGVIVDVEAKQSTVDDRMAMFTGLNAILSHLCPVDANAALIVQNNGVYLLGRLLTLQCDNHKLVDDPNYSLLLCSAFRVLRLLFSLERNRSLFKRLFPASFYEQFIDIGHYIQELSAYEKLVISFQAILGSESEKEMEIQKSLDSINQNRKPLGTINQYLLMEQLGAGAFGCVYRVKKNKGDQQYALKEIFMANTTLDKQSVDSDKSVGDIINEVKMIKEKMRHPFIVRYRRVFCENEKLYILMDLIEGATLKDFINSEKEKKEKFHEDRVWNIVMQIALGLRYLHQDKHIIHRDLKPNNIMLTDDERVVITDFGLAKHRGDSYLKSNVGTILYSWLDDPEMIKDEPYGDKADIWSLGCCVYEMCALVPPFYSTNMLHLATIIVDAKYEPITGYSEELINVITKCLTSNPADRPDILGVSAVMASRLLTCLDEVFCAQHELNQAPKKRTEKAGARSAALTTQSSLEQSSDQVSLTTYQPAPPPGNSTTTRNRPKTTKLKTGSRSANAVVMNATRSRIPQAIPSSSSRPRGSRTISAHVNGAVVALPILNSAGTLPSGQPRLAWGSGGRNGRTNPQQMVLPPIQKSRSTSHLVEDQDMRITSATSYVSIPANKLQPAADPMLVYFNTLYRIMFICEMPTEHSVDPRRRVIEQFKRRLFDKNSTAPIIKEELRKLSIESREPVILNLGYKDYTTVLESLDHDFIGTQRSTSSMTYEQLAACCSSIIQQLNTEGKLDRAVSRLLTPNRRPDS